MSQICSNTDAKGACPVRRSGLESFALQDEAIVYDLARDTVHYLNRTARLVWDRCDGTQTSSRIVRDLCIAFEASERTSNGDRQEIESGIRDSIEMLRRDGLLTDHA